MLNTRDEILRVFAANILDIIPKPPVPNFGQPEPAPENKEDQDNEIEIDPNRFQNTLRELEEQEKERGTDAPFDLPVAQDVPEDRPISIREEEEEEDSEIFDKPAAEHPWLLEDAGTAQWAAEYYPEAFVKGHAPFKGWVLEYPGVAKNYMNDMIVNFPEKYFEWRLGNTKTRQWTDEYERAAAQSLIEKSPEHALMIDLPNVLSEENYDLLVTIWQKLVPQSFLEQREKSIKELWPGVIYTRMLDLVSNIMRKFPDFYEDISIFSAVEEFVKDLDTQGRVKNRSDHMQQISSRDSRDGSWEWWAENYPQTYLKGIDTGKKKGMHTKARSNEQAQLTADTMQRLIETNPIKFFEWDLNVVRDLMQYIKPVALRIIETNPQGAIMERLFRKEVFSPFLPELFNKLSDVMRNEEDSWLSGYLKNLMGSFWLQIKRVRPDFASTAADSPLGSRLEEMTRQ